MAPLLLGILACEGSGELGRATHDRIPPPAAGPGPAFSSGAPAVSCIPPVPDTVSVSIHEVAGVVARDTRDMGGSNDGYLPGQLVDVASAPDGRVYALDGQLGTIWQFSSDLRLEGSWGGRGSGPGEFESPVAIAIDPRDSSVVVAESAPPRLQRFSADGRVLVSTPLRNAPTDLVITETGDVVTAHGTFVDFLHASGRSDWTLIARYDEAFGGRDRLLVITPDSLGTLPFLTRELMIWPQIAEGELLLLFPYSNALLAAAPGDGWDLMAGCIPNEVRDGYEANLADRRESAVAYLLATGAYRAASGETYMTSSLPTADGNYHIDVYDRAGDPARTYVFPARPVRLPLYVTFDGGPDRLLGWEPGGLIARLAISGAGVR